MLASRLVLAAALLSSACGGSPAQSGSAGAVQAEPDPPIKADLPPPDLSAEEIARSKIPERFRKPLVFPKDTARVIDVVPPTRASLHLAAEGDRCPEGNRRDLFVVRDGHVTRKLVYSTLTNGPDGIDIDMPNGKTRRMIPISAIEPETTDFEVWPCVGQPYRPADPEKTYVVKTKGGFGKLVDHTDPRRPIVRNIAAIVAN